MVALIVFHKLIALSTTLKLHNMLVTHTRTPPSGNRISVHQVTSNLTEAIRVRMIVNDQNNSGSAEIST
jgi:hypothetical protein